MSCVVTVFMLKHEKETFMDLFLTSPPQPAPNSQHIETFALWDEEGNVLNLEMSLT